MIENVLIIGIGNLLKKDDGLGIHIIEYLSCFENNLPEWVDLLDGGTLGYDLLEPMSNYSKIVIIDAVETDMPPGSVLRFPGEKITRPGKIYSLHKLGVSSILDMLKISGFDPAVEIIGVVPEDISSDFIGLSESVSSSIPKAATQAIQAARDLHRGYK